VRVTRDFLLRVAARASDVRPAHRRSAGRDVDIEATNAILIHDHTHGGVDWAAASSLSSVAGGNSLSQLPVYCVEIKPKWGVMCRSHLVHVDNHALKHRVCRYCMHQRLKLCKGDIRRVSTFCPIDLFATHNPLRVRRALLGLIQDPQNNFKVFVNGELVWSGEGSADAPIAGLAAVLRRHPLPRIRQHTGSIVGNDDDGSLIDNFIDIVQQCLLDSTVLPSIQRLQLLDKLDVEIVHTIFENLQQKYSLVQLHHMLYDMSSEDSIRDWVQRLERELQAVESTSARFECLSQRPHDVVNSQLDASEFLSQGMDAIIEECKSDDDLAVHLLRAFLIAQTAKDCSLMMTLSPMSSDITPQQDQSNRI
jgi:inositol-pentakisphosphate 2-kinase